MLMLKYVLFLDIVYCVNIEYSVYQKVGDKCLFYPIVRNKGKSCQPVHLCIGIGLDIQILVLETSHYMFPCVVFSTVNLLLGSYCYIGTVCAVPITDEPSVPQHSTSYLLQGSMSSPAKSQSFMPLNLTQSRRSSPN